MSDSSSRGHPLSRIFNPGSIAIVGASADPAKRGYQILRALGASGYRGQVLPVNPKAGSILGHRVYPSLASLPVAADLAVLCTPAASAPDLVRACGERGIAGAVVLAVGFGESGVAGHALEEQLVEAARAGGVRLLGPNTSGMLNLHSGVNLIGARGVRPGGLALLVQSGNMALSLMNETAAKTWEGISMCVGVGNECDIGFTETLEYLGQDDQTRGIVVYAEGLRDARAFLEMASRVSRAKPVVMIKAARSEQGASSALSHTGAVAGSYDRLRSGLAQAGVTEILRTDELIHVVETLANQPPLEHGTGVAILSDGGGQGTLAVDILSDSGVPLAALSDAGRQRLRALLGEAAAVANPVDLAGAADGDPMVFARALEILAEEAEVGAVLLVGLFGGYGIRFAEQLEDAEVTAARQMAERMAQANKALVVHSMYASHRSSPLEALGLSRVPVIESLDVACRCVSELYGRGARLATPSWDAGRGPTPAVPAAAFASARAQGRHALNEAEARDLLAGYGASFGASILVRSAAEAEAALVGLGGAVALKIVSGHIVHKTEAGGVALGVERGDDARRAFEALTRSAREYAVQHDLPSEESVALVTRMAEPPIAELLIGAYRDPGLGPVLTIGSGGTWVEVLRDVTHRVLPVRREEVAEMLAELRIKPLLDGLRGATPADLGAIEAAATAVAECIQANPDIQEIEINPLFVYADRAEPIDARVLL